ncbi:alkaline phosphatase-like protein, partial [Ramaria rubella]
MLKCSKWLAFSVLLYVFLLHASTLYLFTRGFLLTRLSLTNISSCPTSGPACTLPPTHTRMVLLIIDALRFDFVSSNPASTPSPHYHHVLTLPSQLTAQDPTRSFIFNTYADPPTATLQRIKGIMTGSLPTFVDAGSNFGGSQIAEDSLVLQMRKAGRKARIPTYTSFMGDDTWITVYPSSFVPNMTFPFDSFNVEDLHTVDEGVIANIFPLLESNKTADWDLLIGHFLGVDHVGHRLGPAHPTMAAKLHQMNVVLSRIVESLDDQTLLVVIGDHGMDRKGDHGGDGEHETKLFGREDGTLLEQALRLNANQIKGYFDAYRASPSGGELDVVWNHIGRSWASTLNNQD